MQEHVCQTGQSLSLKREVLLVVVKGYLSLSVCSNFHEVYNCILFLSEKTEFRLTLGKWKKRSNSTE